MAAPPNFADRKEEYQQLLDSLIVNPEKIDAIDHIIDRMLKNRRLYEEVAPPLGIPWVGVGLIHCLEGGADMSRRLQDGARLQETDDPESTWQESAIRSLQHQGWHQWQEWSIPGILFKLEEHNGWGYYYHQLNSPYLWSFSQHYTKGKYIRDGVWSATAVSQQAGAAVILHRLLDRGLVSLEGGALVPGLEESREDTPPPALERKPRWLKIAEQEMQLMVRETPDPATDNPRILAYHGSTYGQASSEEVPWCSAFVNWCIEQSELEGTKSARAVSWLRWGRELEEPRLGCIVVLWRSKNPAEGHVGFYWGEEGDRILLLGGNQHNAVNIQGYARSKVRDRGFRWPEEG